MTTTRTTTRTTTTRLAAAALAGALLVSGCGGEAAQGAPGANPTSAAATTSAPGTASAGGAVALSDEHAAALRSLVDAGAVGAVLHVRDGGALSAGAAGSADPATGEPAQAGSPLRIASVTKAAVAAAVMTLVEDGTTALDDPVARHLPGVLPQEQPVTIRHLLSHTSGMPSSPALEVADLAAARATTERVWTDAELVEAALARPWTAPPGERFSYTNEGYVVLGMLLERVTGRPVQDVLAERVFAPAGMASTTWPQDASLPAGALRGQVRTADGRLAAIGEQHPSVWSSGAALVSTAADIDALFAAMSDGTVLSAESWQQVRDVGVEGYGLGVLAGGDACGAQPPQLVVGQRGNGIGTTTLAFGSPDGDRRVVLSWTGGALDPASDPLFPVANAALVSVLASTCR